MMFHTSKRGRRYYGSFRLLRVITGIRSLSLESLEALAVALKESIDTQATNGRGRAEGA